MNQRLKTFENRHKGERAVLVANGPSLNEMSVDFLKQETVIGMNKIFLGFKKFGFYPRYYLAINRLVLQQSAHIIKDLTCTKFIPVHSRSFLPENALTYHVDTDHPPARFSRDISLGIHEGWTVTYAGLQIAYYLGFKEVVIIGMDHRYQFTGAPNEPSKLNGPDPNHFSEDYFGFGQTRDNPDLINSEISYGVARKEYENSGRRIIDATLNGSCNIFEKADYRDIFKLAHHE